jgi:hypothetical protein
MGPPALLPIGKKVCCGFLSLLIIYCFGRVWTRDLGSSGNHTNHYTTEVTKHSLFLIEPPATGGQCQHLLPLSVGQYFSLLLHFPCI